MQIDWQPTITSAAKECREIIAKTPVGDVALVLARDMVERTTRTAAEHMAEHDPHFRAVPVCGEGCAFCCHQSVAMTTPEVVLLAAYLRETYDEQALAKLVTKVVAAAAKTRELTTREWYAQHVPCPLLDVATSTCTAHDARPMRCRAHNSTDVMACIGTFDGGDLDAPVPCNAFQQGAFDAGWLGAMRAMVEAGKDAEVYDLTQALAIALVDPTVAEAWGRGEKPLEKARLPRTLEVTRQMAPVYKAGRKALRTLR